MPRKVPPAIRAWRAMMHVHSSVTAAMDEVLQREVGISAAWYEALVELVLAGGAMRMSDFAEETTLTRSGATRFADRLEKAGLVERRICPEDRRGFELTITDLGRKTQRAAAPHVLGIIDEHIGGRLADAEADLLADALAKVKIGVDS